MKKRTIAVIGVLLGSVVAAPFVVGTAQASTFSTCAKLERQVLRVCSAYAGNSAFGALLPYYSLGRSPNQSQVAEVTDRLEKRYFGVARQLIERRVAGWPKGRYGVRFRISVNRIGVNKMRTRATLITTESWRVYNSDDRSLFKEDQVRHRISMRAVEGLFGNRRWVVTLIN